MEKIITGVKYILVVLGITCIVCHLYDQAKSTAFTPLDTQKADKLELVRDTNSKTDIWKNTEFME